MAFAARWSFVHQHLVNVPYLFVVTMATLLILSSCSMKVTTLYRSEALRPRVSSTVYTQMELTKCDVSRGSTDFGVIFATDSFPNGMTYSYLLIAPKLDVLASSNKVTSLHPNSAVVVTDTAARQLLGLLRRAEQLFDTKTEPHQGSYWRFTTNKLFYAVDAKDSTVYFDPTLEVGFSHNKTGASVTMFVHEDTEVYRSVITSKNDLSCLIEKLSKAVDMFR